MFEYRWKQSMVVCVAVLGLALGACSDDKKNPTEPEPGPEVPMVTTTLRGSVEQLGLTCKSFSMGNPGSIEIEIVELEPLATITMGMGVGRPDSSNPSGCAMFAQDDTVRIFQTFRSSDLAAGTYCTCLYDVGNIFEGETVTYVQEVLHPE